MKIKKGDFGYLDQKKKSELIKTLLMFGLVLAVFFTGYFSTHTRKNLLTVVAILGSLPACKTAVNLFMLLPYKSIKKEIYDKVAARADTVKMAYDLVLTAYEKVTPIDCIAVLGNTLIGYTSSLKADPEFAAAHIRRILTENGFKTMTIKIYTGLNPFVERLTNIQQGGGEEPEEIFEDENNPGVDRNTMIKHTILAISL